MKLHKLCLFSVFSILYTIFTESFAQLTFPTNQIILQNNGLIFHYEFQGDTNTARMGLSINQDVDYFAVGFSTSDNFGMSNFDMVAFIFSPSDAEPSGYSIEVEDLYSVRTGRPANDVSRGGSSDYRIVDSYITDGVRQVIFERDYDTGDSNDYTFDPEQDGQDIAISWAWLMNGQASLEYHGGGNRGTIITPLTYDLDAVEENNGNVEEGPVQEEPVEEPNEETVPEEAPVEETPDPVENDEDDDIEELFPDEENAEETPEPAGKLRSSVPLTFPRATRTNMQNSGLFFSYEIKNETQSIQMGLEMDNDVDYFAVGFSDPENYGMNNFDIVAFIFVNSPPGSDNYIVQVGDYFSSESGQPPTDESLGGQADYKLVKYYIGDGKRQVLFERPLDTGDAYDHTFTPDLETATAVSWAWNKIGQAGLSYHDGNRGTLLMDFDWTLADDDGEGPGGDNDEEDDDGSGSPLNPQQSLKELSFPPSRISVPDGDLAISFEFDDKKQVIKMGLEINRTVDFFGLGFADQGNSGMNDFDLVAFVFTPSDSGSFNVQVLDMYSTENSRPPTDVSRGGTADYKLISYYATENKRQVLFERPYDTGDAYDHTFVHEEGRLIAISWAWLDNGRATFDYHGRQNRGTILTEMYNGLNAVGNEYNTGIDSDLFFKFHAYIFLFLWGVLIDVAIWIARYKKSYQNYITAHMIITGTIFIGTIILAGIALNLRAGGVSGSVYEAHLALGIAILVLSILQVLIGILFRYKIVSYTATVSIPALSRIHMSLGLLTYLIAKIQLIVGLSFYQPDYVGILAAVYAALFVFWTIYNYFYQHRLTLMRKKAKVLPRKNSKIPEHRELMELLNNNVPVSEIMQVPSLMRLKWAILDNKVFELGKFTHPGGNFIMKQINGREIGRFVYGVAALESSLNNQHTHSKQVAFIVRKNLIGTIQNNHHVLVPLSSVSSERSQTVSMVPSKFNWSLVKKTTISSHTSKFLFSCDQFEVDPWIRDIRHIGRHMRVSHVSRKKVRLYTLVLSQTEARIQRRELLADKMKGDVLFVEGSARTPNIKTLPLIIKKYESPKKKTFSSFVHNSREGTSGFSLEGPYGTGFGLTPESTGLHVIFAAGTGILPFLDLFDYLLESVFDQENYTNIFKNGFKLQIFASFGAMEDFVGLDICEKLIQACNQNGYKGAVKLTIRMKEAEFNKYYNWTSECFDDEFVNKYVESDCQKVYICGPPAFNQKIPSGLEKMGMDKTKIMLV